MPPINASVTNQRVKVAERTNLGSLSLPFFDAVFTPLFRA